MAQQSKSPQQTLQQMAQESLETIQKNFRTQGIFPFEVYPGYAAKNRGKEGKPGEWFSTGEGYKSFSFSVPNASDTAAEIDFFYNAYLDFVDMGVGKGRKWDAVQHNYNARYSQRYTRWDAASGLTHRPAFAMEFRHLRSRMRNYFEGRLQQEVYVMLFQTLQQRQGVE